EACAEASRRLFTTDPAAAVRLSEQACNGGSLAGCTNLGSATVLGLGGLPKDFDKAIALYDRACKGGIGISCSAEASAWIHREGNPTPDERARAAASAKRGCELGSAGGCAIAFALLPPNKMKQGIDASGVGYM